MISPQSVSTLDDHPTLQPFFIGTMSLPPGLNKSYQIGKYKRRNGTTGELVTHSRIIATPELEAFKDAAYYELCRATQDYSLINAIRSSIRLVPLGVVMYLHLPPAVGRTKKRDIDGVIKAAQDAAFLKMELNDELVDDLRVIKYRDSLNPRIDIEVRCLLLNRG